MQRWRAWDLPIRLFHWALVAAVALSFYTVKTSGAPLLFPLEWHARAGYIVLGLLVFRWVWGSVGTGTSRLRPLLRGPRKVTGYLWAFLKGRPPAYLGHNPLGGLMVWVMLLSLSSQALTGLFMSDAIFFDAPLHGLLGQRVGDWLSWWHHVNGEWLMWLIGLHLLALVAHRLCGEKLVTAMLHGRKTLTRSPVDGRVGGSMRPAIGWLAAGVATALVVTLWRL